MVRQKHKACLSRGKPTLRTPSLKFERQACACSFSRFLDNETTGSGSRWIFYATCPQLPSPHFPASRSDGGSYPFAQGRLFSSSRVFNLVVSAELTAARQLNCASVASKGVRVAPDRLFKRLNASVCGGTFGSVAVLVTNTVCPGLADLIGHRCQRRRGDALRLTWPVNVTTLMAGSG